MNAQISLMHKLLPIDTIRNITLRDTSEPNSDCAKVLEQLQKDNFCAEDECQDEESTNRVAEKLQQKYKDSIIIKKTDPTRPMIKIIRIQTDIENNDEIVQQMKEQNSWLRDLHFKITDKYDVITSAVTYKNIILSCDLSVHKKFMEHGVIILGFKESRCVEHVNLTQCKRCARFGHFIHSCTYKVRCKKRTVEHLTSDCQITENFKCCNCSTIFANDDTIRNQRSNVRQL